jgi:hypothetical protein
MADKGWRYCSQCSGDDESDDWSPRYVEEISPISYIPISPSFTEEDLAHCTCFLCFNCWEMMLFIEPRPMRKCGGNCRLDGSLPVYPGVSYA